MPEPSDIIFFSDSLDELNAAQKIGILTYRIKREGVLGDSSPHN